MDTSTKPHVMQSFNLVFTLISFTFVDDNRDCDIHSNGRSRKQCGILPWYAKFWLMSGSCMLILYTISFFLIFLNNNVFMNLFYLLSYVHKNCRHDMPCNIIRIMFNLFFTHCWSRGFFRRSVVFLQYLHLDI